MTEREERIRRRAYELWEAADRPEGKDEYFWNLASADIAAEDAEAQSTHPSSTVPPKP